MNSPQRFFADRYFPRSLTPPIGPLSHALIQDCEELPHLGLPARWAGVCLDPEVFNIAHSQEVLRSVARTHASSPGLDTAESRSCRVTGAA
jgi:hypothetical protein